MQIQARAYSDVKLQYINGHFAYGFKGTLICNAHDILRHIQVDDFDQDIKELEHLKHINDSKPFVPSLNNFTSRHPNIQAKHICGDSGFDSSFNLIPVIDINQRNTDDDIPDATYMDETLLAILKIVLCL